MKNIKTSYLLILIAVAIILISLLLSPLVIVFLLMLTFIICVHEFGHFIMSKRFGVTVEEFSIGMGPLVYKKDYKGTQYSIRALPIGGYVKLFGQGEASEEAGSYSQIAAWKRFIIIYAGVFMNFVLVAVLFTIFAIKSNFAFYGLSINPNYTYPIADSGLSKVGIAGVQEGSPAQLTGIKSLDVINLVDNKNYNGFDSYVKILDANLEKNITYNVVSYLGGDSKTVNVFVRDKVKENLSDKQSRTGIIPSSFADGTLLNFRKVEYHGIQKPFAGILQTINATHNYVSTIGDLVGTAFAQKDASIISNSLSSPVATYGVTQKIFSLEGGWGLVTLTALISLAIGLMNAVPFPALDGWHGLFIIIEIITKRKVNERIYNAITTAGFVLLLALGAFLIIKDVLNYSTLFG